VTTNNDNDIVDVTWYVVPGCHEFYTAITLDRFSAEFIIAHWHG